MASLFDRRRILGALGVGSVGLAAAACAQPVNRPLVAPVSADQVRATAAAASNGTATGHGNGHGAAGQAAGNAQGTASGRSKADEMDAHHEKGVKAFPAKTEGLGGQRLQPRLDGDVKVFELTCGKVQWEVEPGKRVEAFAYNGVVPGPEIRVVEGDTVRVILTNNLDDQSTAIHFHGQRTPNAMDGVPFITQAPIKPGQTFTYEFVARPSGSHMYHSHHNATEQVTKGLLGAFIVDPKDPALRPKVDAEYVMILNDGPLGFTLNGKGFPATAPLTAKLGQKILVRFMNEGLMIHPMHLHGMPMLVTHKDGYPLPQPYWCDTLNVAPGDRYDAIIECDEPGVWAFHCHVLSHAEMPSGMFGMVTALIVEA
jgi:FtsP/CotA-like multicopper oxidase with cupredoxin domain